SVQQSQKRSLRREHQTCPSRILPSAVCQAPDRATNSSPGPALTPTTSQAPRVASSPTLKSERPDAVAQKAGLQKTAWSGEIMAKDAFSHECNQFAIKNKRCG